VSYGLCERRDNQFTRLKRPTRLDNETRKRSEQRKSVVLKMKMIML
jgi:hypothetical protein